MNRILTTAAFVTLSLAAVPATAQDAQLVANAGLTPAEAEGMSLNQIAAAMLNRGSDRGEWQPVAADYGQVRVDPARHGQLIAAAELSPAEARGLTLTDLAVGKHNAEARYDDRQGVVVSSRGASPDRGQFIAAAGLTPEEARGMTLNEIAVAKFNRDSDYD
jgi:hypothetical protein